MIQAVQNNSMPQNPQKTDHLQKLQSVNTVSNAQDRAKTEEQQNVAKPRYDEYIKSNNTATDSTGIYRLAKDKQGNARILYDSPNQQNKAVDGAENNQSNNPAGGPDGAKDGKTIMKSTVNTDKVDAEIKRLKEKKQELEQQIQQAAGDSDKVQRLRQRLSDIENELRVKDNDNYRKQHASYTYNGIGA